MSPVALQPGNDLDADPRAARAASAGYDEAPGYDEHREHEHASLQHAPAHGLLSELVLTAMVALGVALTTLAALYTAGAFRPPRHHELPGSQQPSVPASSQTSR